MEWTDNKKHHSSELLQWNNSYFFSLSWYRQQTIQSAFLDIDTQSAFLDTDHPVSLTEHRPPHQSFWTQTIQSAFLGTDHPVNVSKRKPPCQPFWTDTDHPVSLSGRITQSIILNTDHPVSLLGQNPSSWWSTWTQTIISWGWKVCNQNHER